MIAVAERLSPVYRLIAGMTALLAVLCLPAAHALHLRLDASHDVTARHDVSGSVHADHGSGSHDHESEAPHAPHRHDAAHCTVCISLRSLDVAPAMLGVVVLSHFDSPPTPAAPTYVAPAVDDAIVPLLAIPRGPPALA